VSFQGNQLINHANQMVFFLINVVILVIQSVHAVSFVPPWTPRTTSTSGQARPSTTGTLIATSSIAQTWTVPVSGILPDFTVDKTWLEKSLYIDHVNASEDACLIQEGCVNGLGMRKVLRFGTLIHNLGPGDAVLGKPPTAPNLPGSPPWFEWSECHRHWHYISYADYRITDTNQTNARIVAQGHKSGFCLMDSLSPINSQGFSEAKYDCDNQGISAGSGDLYDDGLTCQWVDITGISLIPTTTYYVEIHVNPNRTFPEANYANNKISVPFRPMDLDVQYSGKLERPADAAPVGTFQGRSGQGARKVIEVPGYQFVAQHGRHD